VGNITSASFGVIQQEFLLCVVETNLTHMGCEPTATRVRAKWLRQSGPGTVNIMSLSYPRLSTMIIRDGSAAYCRLTDANARN
jgi:hypothetical protein